MPPTSPSIHPVHPAVPVPVPRALAAPAELCVDLAVAPAPTSVPVPVPVPVPAPSRLVVPPTTMSVLLGLRLTTVPLMVTAPPGVSVVPGPITYWVAEFAV